METSHKPHLQTTVGCCERPPCSVDWAGWSTVRGVLNSLDHTMENGRETTQQWVISNTAADLNPVWKPTGIIPPQKRTIFNAIQCNIFLSFGRMSNTKVGEKAELSEKEKVIDLTWWWRWMEMSGDQQSDQSSWVERVENADRLVIEMNLNAWIQRDRSTAFGS